MLSRKTKFSLLLPFVMIAASPLRAEGVQLEEPESITRARPRSDGEWPFDRLITRGVNCAFKAGIIFDAPRLLADVPAIVCGANHRENFEITQPATTPSSRPWPTGPGA